MWPVSKSWMEQKGMYTQTSQGDVGFLPHVGFVGFFVFVCFKPRPLPAPPG